jgi:hypothetical protein
MRTSKCIMSANSPILRRKDGRSHPCGNDAWRLAAGHPWSCAVAATSASNMVDTMDQASDVLVTGEPRETETLTRGSERGRWKSTHQGNSLAAYSTARTVTTGGRGKHSLAVRPVPTQLPQGGRDCEMLTANDQASAARGCLRVGCMRWLGRHITITIELSRQQQLLQLRSGPIYRRGGRRRGRRRPCMARR